MLQVGSKNKNEGPVKPIFIKKSCHTSEKIVTLSQLKEIIMRQLFKIDILPFGHADESIVFPI